MNYTARALPGEVVLNDEAVKHMWVDGREAMRTLPLNTPTRLLLERVFSA